MNNILEDFKIELFQGALIKWFEKRGRDFSWRKTNDPYKILLSEILLQKTNAEKVEPVYEEIIEDFPAPKDLAKSDLEELRNKVEPLGLVKRADWLQKIGKKLSEKGNWRKAMRNRQFLMDLPGVGDYVANSVLCLAFSKDLPMVDSNVSRVISRVFSHKRRKPAYSDSELWNFLDSLIPKNDSKKFNLSLIDLSAIHCRPNKPKCINCPITAFCKYAQRGARKENRG